jgi:integrase
MARRQSNVRRRGNSWVIHYRRDGKQHWRSFAARDYGGRLENAKEAALLELARVEMRRATDQPEPTARKMTVAKHAQDWLDHKRGRVGEQTFVNYASVLNVHVLPTLGDIELRRVGRKLLDDFVSDWAAGGPWFKERVQLAQDRERQRAAEKRRPARSVRLGTSPKTIGNAIVVLSAMFNDAVKWQRIAASPAAALERPKDNRPPDETMRPLDMNGLRQLVAAAETPFARALLMTAGLTGARRGELLALRWSDIDYVNRRVWVRRAIGLGGVKTPKTRGSIRAITLTPVLAAELEGWWKQTSFRGGDDYVFASSTGTWLDGRNMDRTMFEPARRRAGLSLRFHDLRHTFASILIAAGVHPKAISEQLGHASVAITMDRYGHLFDRSYSDVSDELELAWAASGAVANLGKLQAETASGSSSNGAAVFQTDAAVDAETPVTKAA